MKIIKTIGMIIGIIVGIIGFGIICFPCVYTAIEIIKPAFK